jgi:hypothetical protein
MLSEFIHLRAVAWGWEAHIRFLKSAICRHSKALPRVAGGGDGLQIRCKYAEHAVPDSRQVAVHLLGGWAESQQSLVVK